MSSTGTASTVASTPSRPPSRRSCTAPIRRNRAGSTCAGTRRIPPIGKSDPRFGERVADLASALRGVARDTLIGDNVRQHRRALRLARAAVTVLSVLLVLSIVASILAVGQRNEAREQARISQARQLAATARSIAGTEIGTGAAAGRAGVPAGSRAADRGGAAQHADGQPATGPGVRRGQQGLEHGRHRRRATGGGRQQRRRDRLLGRGDRRANRRRQRRRPARSDGGVGRLHGDRRPLREFGQDLDRRPRSEAATRACRPVRPRWASHRPATPSWWRTATTRPVPTS